MTTISTNHTAPIAQSRIVRIGLYIIVVLLPAIITITLLRVRLDSTPLEFIPTWSDEFIYWHEILTFKDVGFDGGYYTFEELPAPVGFTHFDPHGPVYPALLGTIARVTGWEYSTPVLYNLAYLSAALTVFLCFIKPTRKQLLWLVLALITFYPMHLFIPTAMQESFHQAAGIILSILFFIRLQRGEDTPRWVDFLFVALIILISLIRLTWSFLCVPYFLLMTSRRWLAPASAIIVIAGSILFYRYFSSPYPSNFVSFFFRQLAENPSISHIIYILYSYFLENVARLGTGDLLTIAERVQVFIVVVWGLGIMIVRRTRFFRRLPRPQMHFVEAGLHLFNVGVMLIINLQVYTISYWIDYRVFAPHLLMSLLLLIAFNRFRLAGILITINLLTVVPFLEDYRSLNLNSFTVNREQLAEFDALIDSYISYNTQTENAWCNTVYAPQLDYRLIALPPGVGFTIAREMKNVSAPFQSLYVLLNTVYEADLRNRFGELNLEPLTETYLGTLYRNRDTNCT